MSQTVTFKYTFSSATGCMEGSRYNKEFNLEIFSEDQDGHVDKLIGKIKFHIVYVAMAIDDGYDVYEIFDDKETTFRIGTRIFDFEQSDLNEDILQFYDEVMFVSNICFLERIEILPEYRGTQIGAKAIRDIYFHFGHACELLVAQVFPLQFEVKRPEQEEWLEHLSLERFEKDEKKAFKKLFDYYLSIGFNKIPKYHDLVFINTFKVSNKFQSINLEE